MLSGSSQCVDSVVHFLLSERKLVVTLPLLDLVDVVVLSLLVSNRQNQRVDVVDEQLSG